MRALVLALVLVAGCASVPMPKTECVANAATPDAAAACIRALSADGGAHG